VLKRNFWFCTLEDRSTIDTRHRIGVDHIMVEVDYPHGDSTWPDTQAVIADAWGHIPPAELRRLCCENAAELYRHALPDQVLPL
jgi:predicted TIM-barrel fold metal-dependent hydrolase